MVLKQSLDRLSGPSTTPGTLQHRNRSSLEMCHNRHPLHRCGHYTDEYIGYCNGRNAATGPCTLYQRHLRTVEEKEFCCSNQCCGQALDRTAQMCQLISADYNARILHGNPNHRTELQMRLHQLQNMWTLTQALHADCKATREMMGCQRGRPIDGPA